MPPFTQILVRTEVPPLSIVNSVHRQIQLVDADQQVEANVRSLEERITTQPQWAQQHLVAMRFGAFAALALCLAAVGLYSVVSYTVAQRTNEFGVRMALGAQRRDVLRMVFRSTIVSVGGGIVAGIVLSLAMKGVIAQWAQGGLHQLGGGVGSNGFACHRWGYGMPASCAPRVRPRSRAGAALRVDLWPTACIEPAGFSTAIC